MAMLNLPIADRLPPEEQELIPALRDFLAADARRWLGPEGDCLPSRGFDNVATVVACSAPRAEANALALCVRYAMWTYLFDYRCDDLGELGTATDAALAVLAEPPTPGAGFVARSLAELCAELTHAPSAP